VNIFLELFGRAGFVVVEVGHVLRDRFGGREVQGAEGAGFPGADFIKTVLAENYGQNLIT
jgi:hypothetical protein